MKKAIAIKLLKSKTARNVAIKALRNKKIQKIVVARRNDVWKIGEVSIS